MTKKNLPATKKQTPEMLAARVGLVQQALIDGKTYDEIEARHNLSHTYIRRIASSPEVQEVFRAQAVLLAAEMRDDAQVMLKLLRDQVGGLMPHQLITAITKFLESSGDLLKRDDAPEARPPITVDASQAENVQVILQNMGVKGGDLVLDPDVADMLDQIPEESE